MKLSSKLKKEEILQILVDEYQKTYREVEERSTDWREGRHSEICDILRRVKIDIKED